MILPKLEFSEALVTFRSNYLEIVSANLVTQVKQVSWTYNFQCRIQRTLKKLAEW